MSQVLSMTGRRLYGIFDPALFAGADWSAAIAGALAGGVSALQLRCKSPDRDEVIRWAERLGALTAPAGVPLIINDNPTVAMAADAQGVHLGATDMDPAAARALMGADAIIGVTIHNASEAGNCDVTIADYFGVGPFAATASKADTLEPLGAAGLAGLCSALKARAPDTPVYAIAGIDAGNAADVISAGVDGVAVISAIFGVEDTETAARTIGAAIDPANRGRRP